MRNAPSSQLLPSILQSPANVSYLLNPAKRQLARSLENTTSRRQPSPSPVVEEKRERARDGFEDKQSNQGHSPNNFAERGYRA